MHENTALEFEIAVYMHRKHTNLQPHFIDFSLRSQNTGIIHTFELRAAKTYVKSMYNRLSVHTITDIGRISLSNDEICVEGGRIRAPKSAFLTVTDKSKVKYERKCWFVNDKLHRNPKN